MAGPLCTPSSEEEIPVLMEAPPCTGTPPPRSSGASWKGEVRAQPLHKSVCICCKAIWVSELQLWFSRKSVIPGEERGLDLRGCAGL